MKDHKRTRAYRWPAVFVSLVFLLAAWPVFASADQEPTFPKPHENSATSRILGGSGVVMPGDMAFLDASAHGRWCRLSVNWKGKTKQGAAQKIRTGRVRASWKVPRTAGSGVSRIGIRCAGSKRKLRGSKGDVLVVRVRRGHGSSSAIPIKSVKLKALVEAGEGDLEEGLPDGTGDPDDFRVELPEGVGGGGFGTYWPFSQGTRTRITQGPGGAASHSDQWNRYAVDLGVPFGTQVRAGFYGVVARVNTGCAASSIGCGSGYGNYVLVKAADGTCAIHAHLSQVQVQLGQQLKTYDPIGLTGNTGTSYGTHLHYGRVNCASNVSLPWSPIEGGSLAEGATVISQNHPGAGNAVVGPDKSTKYHFTYFVGADGDLRISHWTGSGWQNDDLYQGVLNGTSPSAYIASNGQHHVYFVGNDGVLRLSLWTGTSWRTDNLGQNVASGTSPSAYQAPNGQHFVYFVGSDGSLRVSHWTGTTWQHDNLYQGVLSGTSPSAYVTPDGGHHVVFVGNDGVLRMSLWTGTYWRTDNLGQHAAAGSSPSAYYVPGGLHFIYFVGSDGTLRVSHFTGTGWQHDNLYQGVATGTSPSAYATSKGQHHVYFVGNDGSLRLSLWTGTIWRTDNLGQGVLAGTSPSAYRTTSDQHHVYFTGNDGSLRLSLFTGTEWRTDNLGQAVRPGTSPSSYPAS